MSISNTGKSSSLQSQMYTGSQILTIPSEQITKAILCSIYGLSPTRWAKLENRIVQREMTQPIIENRQNSQLAEE